VIYDVRETKLSSAEFLERIARYQVLGVPVDAERIRMVTHLDVDRSDVDAAVGSIADALRSRS
jgi:threonine aldolase